MILDTFRNTTSFLSINSVDVGQNIAQGTRRDNFIPKPLGEGSMSSQSNTMTS